ncbi:MAG: hypothetical protein J2P26_01930 [Nocardiopsaceae bacterium]|nr:hypothetical protein [Nocardiopsaceae bacterium]
MNARRASQVNGLMTRLIATTENTMITIVATGSTLGYPEHAGRWHTLLNSSGYSEDQATVLVDAPIHAQRDEMEKLLPPGCTWRMHTAEIIGPVDLALDGNGDEGPYGALALEAFAAVAARFADIARATLGE